MSNYVKSTNFATKDSLPLGDPAKIVKGTEIDTEFNNIATAVGTKADLLSPAFTGTPTAPTASPGTNTTQIATTAFTAAAIQAVKETMYPVGSVYINASDSTNPSVLFGFGTWVTVGDGRVLVNQDTSDTSFDTLGETGGSKDAILVSHTHTATVTDPGHSHGVPTYVGASGSAIGNSGTNSGPFSLSTASATTGISVSNSSAGVSATNGNLQPYVVVRMWKRTA